MTITPFSRASMSAPIMPITIQNHYRTPAAAKAAFLKDHPYIRLEVTIDFVCIEPNNKYEIRDKRLLLATIEKNTENGLWKMTDHTSERKSVF